MRFKPSILVLIVVLVLVAAVPSAAAPLAGPCVAGAAYDPACDVDQDGDVDIFDVQLTASRWNRTGTFTSDNNHNHLGQTWTGANNPLKFNGAFGAPDYAPIVLNNTQGHGLSIPNASINGIYVGATGAYGVVANDVTQDGFYAGTAGNASSATFSSESNGFEVAGAQGYGLYVGRADIHGVRVVSAGGTGLRVDSANYGVDLVSAGFSGVLANTTQASGQWGFYTDDAIRGSNVTLSSLTVIAQVAGAHALNSGDLVAAVGVTDPLPDSSVPLALVSLADATAASGIVGVVEGRMALTAQPRHEEEQEQEPIIELRSTDGPAQPGDYVALTVLGVAQVKVQTGEAIQPGQRLTAADTPGRARALRTVHVEGVSVDESGPTLGVALEASKDGMVWVLVNPQ